MRTFIFKPAAIALLLLVGAGCDNKAKIMTEVTTTPTTAVADYATDTHIDQGTKAFLKVLNTSGGKPLNELSKEEARNVLVGAQAAMKVDLSGIEESEKTITADGHTIKLNISRPAGKSGKLPAFMFIHGGGWILGDYPTHQRFVRDLVVASGFTAVFVNYTPSPEAQYPQALNEIYAATKWVSEHGDEINVDPSKLAMVGNSAGGNMAAAVTMMTKEKNGPDLKMLLLFWPVTDTGFNTESYAKYANDRFLTAPVMKWMFDQYTTDEKARKDAHISLVSATKEQLKGFPPTLIQVAENDILRDEGETFGRLLDEAGVDATTVRYNSMIHDFGLLNALANLPTTKALFEHAGAALQKNLK
ncbi:alpha/beta hydrolase [Flavobacterium sp.]|uniref:alpha/beta hydrolase n=1 Tax=Flavobacterium sp. TaxID=239 RepID=UPI0039E367B4